MTYDEALLYLDSRKNLGSRPGLATIYALLKQMGNPEQNLKVIHIAGTNGKGSVGSMLSSVLSKVGYRVGFFSSPALFNVREMIRLNGVEISEEKLAKALTAARKGAEVIEEQEGLLATEFEVMTGAAYLFFAQQNCDYAVIECGMGGALDATNVNHKTAVSVLTRIDYDHTGFLGDSLSCITKNKCGILRSGRPVVVYPEQEAEVLQTILAESKAKEATLHVADKKALQIKEITPTGSYFTYGNYPNVFLSLCGRHQIYNAITAIEVIMALKEQGVFIAEDAVYQGLANAKWLGRFEILSQEPPVILDGAHNPNGVKAFADALQKTYPDRSFIGVVGMLRDKDVAKCLKMLSEVCETLVLTTVQNPRSIAVEELAALAKELQIPCIIEENPAEAVTKTFSMRKKGQGVFCVGSLYNLSVYKESCQKYM